MKKGILVTGAAGFIGSNLCHLLCNDVNQEKYIVFGVDALLKGSNKDNLKNLPMSFYEMNLCNAEAVDRFFQDWKIDKVIHLAAESHVDRSINDDSNFWQSNVVGTSNLMRSIMKYGDATTIVNQITDEAYGEKPDSYAKEGDKFAPTSPYPCSKVAQYFVGQSFKTTYGLPIVSTFPVNCFGPRQDPEKLIPKFITNLLQNKKVPLMESSHFERDWLPVSSMARALLLLAEQGVPGDYNVGADNHHTNKELTYKLLEQLGKDKSFIEMVPDRKAHDCRYAVDSTKIQKLGFKIGVDFDNYLSSTIRWYGENYGIHA